MKKMRYFAEDQLVIATHNKGKLREIRAPFDGFGFRVISAASLGIAEPEETESSFRGNALLKARAAAATAKLPALADDSGLVVAALKGAPGIYSARCTFARRRVCGGRGCVRPETDPSKTSTAYKYTTFTVSPPDSIHVDSAATATVSL